MSIVSQNGILQSICANGRTYPFRSEPEHAGPVLHIVYAGRESVGDHTWEEDGWRGVYYWGVSMYTRVEETADGARIRVRMVNRSSQTFRPDRVSLSLGIDCYMERYPDWNRQVFPTLLRCEKTHFWGYFRSPLGAILGIACPDPIPSWALEYNRFFCDGGHRIYTARLDLLSIEKQPGRHPSVESIRPGEEKNWTIDLFDAPDLDALMRAASKLCRAPMLCAERLILERDERAFVTIYSPEKPVLSEGEAVQTEPGAWRAALSGEGAEGCHTLRAAAAGHESELIFYRRRDWSFYLKAARRAALDMPQKTGSHCESWYGLFSAFEAARFFPCAELDEPLLRRFEALLPLAFDAETGEPTRIAGRIQNTATLVSLCADAWQATRESSWLETGARFADFLIDKCQNEDGVFFSYGGTHYTCVIYIAKSILELWLAEKDQPGFAVRAEKHYKAARRAIDELVRNRDNIGTEGEHTFEDGMISCAVTQIAMMGLLVPEDERAPYIEAAEAMLSKHRCLERLNSVDARSRNTTLRFWEAQYDVLIPANMINSPHGWSGWKIYGVWYLYLLTGKREYLVDAMETLGSCAQLIDLDGSLRWAFVPDPCIHAGFWKPDENGEGFLTRETFGETYVDMISGWYRAPENTPVFGYLGTHPEFGTDQGGCCDNDVHECFKALAEVALAYGYLYEADGALQTYNGTARATETEIHFTPREACMRALHVSLPHETRVTVHFANQTVTRTLRTGWLHADGHISQGLPEA